MPFFSNRRKLSGRGPLRPFTKYITKYFVPQRSLCSSVGRAVDCSSCMHKSIGHWFDSGRRDFCYSRQLIVQILPPMLMCHVCIQRSSVFTVLYKNTNSIIDRFSRKILPLLGSFFPQQIYRSYLVVLAKQHHQIRQSKSVVTYNTRLAKF